MDTLKQRVTVVICHTVIQTNSQERMQEAMDKEQNRKMDAVHNGQVINSDAGEQNIFANVARNDLCPCGSGKKFKHCHGRIVG